MPNLESPENNCVLDALDVGLIVLDEDCRIVVWNDWIASASGTPHETALSQRLHDLFPGASQTRLATAVVDALTAGTSSLLSHSLHAAVFPLKTNAGRVMTHNVTVRPLPGRPTRCLIQVNDVTVTAERERVLRERQNARYDAVVLSAPDSILTLSADGVIQFANPAAAKQFGYLTSDLIGMRGSELFIDRHVWETTWATLLREGSLGRPLELEGRRKDGSLSYLEISASCWQSHSRIFVTAILRDINERRAAESALRSLNQTLEQRVAERTADRDRMWRLSSDVMLVTRTDGIITAVNPAWSGVLGWNEKQLLASNIAAFVFEEDRPILAKGFAELLESRRPRLFELRMRTGSGGSRMIAWSAVAADDLIQAVGRDVTVEREAEEALHQAEGALRQSQKMEAIGQLTGGIAHDFNNLLTGIIGAMEMMKRRIAKGRYDDLPKFMNAAILSANRAASLTHRLLAFARQQSLDPQALDLNRLVEGMTDLLQRSLGEHIQLDVKLGSDVWPAVSDENQLENALLNLVINARDAMPDGGRLTIETSNVSVTTQSRVSKDDIEPGDYTIIAVSDTGTGMSEDVLAKVFDPFFTTKPIGQGTGLGLSMVYGFVKQSNGHVRIESELGTGTKVKLYFPRFKGEVGGQARIEVAELPRGAGETVLLVEDDTSVRLLIAEVLRELGYACIEANDGTAALPVLNSEIRLDLMISDVGLPGINGRQLADIGRQRRPKLKVLFVTGYSAHATIRGGFLESGMEMITKPFNLDDLAKKIRTMIE